VLGLALLEMVPLFLPGIFQYGGFGFRLLLNPDTDPDPGIKTSTKDEGKFRKASGHPKRHIALKMYFLVVSLFLGHSCLWIRI
jgi:hypothetical protein